MVLEAKNVGALVLRLMVVLALLGCARMGSAQGTWSVISLPQQPGEVLPTAVAVDNAGNLYVADTDNHTIRKITPARGVTTIAGLAGSSGSADGSGNAARLRRSHHGRPESQKVFFALGVADPEIGGRERAKHAAKLAAEKLRTAR